MKIKIPKGWRKIGVGRIIKHGDKWYDYTKDKWVYCTGLVGLKEFGRSCPTIRKLSKNKKSKMTMAELAGKIYGLKKKK